MLPIIQPVKKFKNPLPESKRIHALQLADEAALMKSFYPKNKKQENMASPESYLVALLANDFESPEKYLEVIQMAMMASKVHPQNHNGVSYIEHFLQAQMQCSLAELKAQAEELVQQRPSIPEVERLLQSKAQKPGDRILAQGDGLLK